MKRGTLERNFAKAYDQYVDAIFRHIAYRLEDRERAREITQEVFMRAWDYAAVGHTIKDYRALLYTIAHNLIVNEYSRRRPSVSLDELEAEGFDQAGDTADQVVANAEYELLLSHIGTLPAHYRDVVVMRHIDDLPVWHIAELLGISESNVSVRLNRALAFLRKKFPAQ